MNQVTHNTSIDHYKVLSIDAWADSDGGWQWNQWFYVDRYPKARPLTTRCILSWMRAEGYNLPKGRVAIDDDGYNMVIISQSDQRPLYAIEYGSEQ